MRAVATRVVLLALGFALAAGAAGVAQQRAARRPAVRPPAQPRMPWGDPDLEGVWTSDNNFSVPLERPADVKDKELLEGAISRTRCVPARRRSRRWPTAVWSGPARRTGTRT